MSRLGLPGARRAALAITLASAGCLSVPEDAAPMCHSTSDCASDLGEVCEEGVCWGNPPEGLFSALLSPPSRRTDLVAREFPELALPKDGWMGELKLAPPVAVTGRVVEFCPPPTAGCDATPIGATVAVSRASSFRGGPGFKAVLDVEPGAASFSLLLPRPFGDAPFIITVTPEGGQEPRVPRSAAERVPPLRLQLTPSTGLKTFELGGPGLPVIQGTLANALGQGLAGYRVVALGRWDSAAAASEVSSVGFTDSSGAYSITLSAGLVGTVEVVARPPRGVAAATVHLTGIDATRSAQRNVIEPLELGRPSRQTIRVTGLDRGGSVADVSGATVILHGALELPQVTFSLDSEQVTSERGLVTLDVLDGAALLDAYRLSIVPPASASLGVVFDQRLPGAQPIRLPGRIAVTGRVLDSALRPLASAAVTARPSLRFLWSLEALPQTFLATIPAAAAVTTADGGFVLWVDPRLAEVPGLYDIVVEPAVDVLAPSSIRSEVYVPGAASTAASLGVGDIVLPEAAFVHGRVLDATGNTVEGAELRLYRWGGSNSALCDEVAHAPASCPVPAQLQGRSTSDREGTIRVVLPR